MINSTGDVQSLMIVGGSSEIGLAVFHRFTQTRRLNRLVLVGRNLGNVTQQIAAGGYEGLIDSVEIDLTNLSDLDAAIRKVWNEGVDVVVLTAGVLPRPDQSPLDVNVALNAAFVNYVSQMAIGTTVVDRMVHQGFGTLVVVSSVAVERPRKDNFVYGSSKSGLDSWAQGMADYLHGLPIRIFVVRPGMVRTHMSRHLPDAPMTVNTEDVARVIEKHLIYGPVVVWVPSRIRWLFVVLRHLPRWVFRRLSPPGGSAQRTR